MYIIKRDKETLDIDNIKDTFSGSNDTLEELEQLFESFQSTKNFMRTENIRVRNRDKLILLRDVNTKLIEGKVELNLLEIEGEGFVNIENLMQIVNERMGRESESLEEDIDSDLESILDYLEESIEKEYEKEDIKGTNILNKLSESDKIKLVKTLDDENYIYEYYI